MSKRSKRYTNIQEQSEKRTYSIEEAIALIKKTSSAKFDESIEAHINLGIDPKKSEQTIRGILVLPHGSGRSIRIAVFSESKETEAKKAGADLVGGKELIAEILKTKKINFDAAIATPDFMREIAKAAKILGPKGLMPSPKDNSVTEDVGQAIKRLRAGQISFRNDNAGNIHQIIGKVSWDDNKIKENFRAFIDEIRKRKPKGIKGSYIKSITLCSTMGPGIKLVI